MAKAELNGCRVLLFVNNPHLTATNGGWITPDGMAYDVLTDPAPTSYSVRVNARSVEDGDVALVYRVGAHATRRDPGAIVAVAQISSSPWFNRHGDAFVNWTLYLLPPESWIHSREMKSSGLWVNRSPLHDSQRASFPVELHDDQWAWVANRLPAHTREWLAEWTAGGQDTDLDEQFG